MKLSVVQKLQKWLRELTWREALNLILVGFFLALFACFFDWLIINWLSGCCEGGICIPEWLYPQCQAHGGHYGQ